MKKLLLVTGIVFCAWACGGNRKAEKEQAADTVQVSEETLEHLTEIESSTEDLKAKSERIRTKIDSLLQTLEN